MVDVINASSGRSFVSETLVPERVLTGLWPRCFRLAPAREDIGIADALATELGVDAPVLAPPGRTTPSAGWPGDAADYLDPIRAREHAAASSCGMSDPVRRRCPIHPCSFWWRVQDLVNLASCVRIAKNLGSPDPNSWLGMRGRLLPHRGIAPIPPTCSNGSRSTIRSTMPSPTWPGSWPSPVASVPPSAPCSGPGQRRASWRPGH